MSAATIIFTDIVGFSKKSTAEQYRLVNAITGEVIYQLRSLLNPPHSKPSILALPTGDGIALAFLHDSNKSWDRSNILNLLVKLQKWAFNETNEKGFVALRIGVHVGPVEIITDVNGRPNICGDTINYAQRVMDAANPRQILFSEAAFREYVGSEKPCCPISPAEDLKAEFHGPIEVFAKHGLQILVYKLTISPAQDWLTNEDPVSKHLMLVSLTPLPKEVVGTFSERVRHAQQIAFIQLTGDRFVDNFNNGCITFSQNLKRFWVFMPDPGVYKHLHLHSIYATAEYVNECIEKWKGLMAQLKEKNTNADLKLGLFKEPPFFGASFIDWDRPGGKVHISPYIWNVAAQRCPGYDLEWIGSKPSNIYEHYVEGLQYLNSQTVNIAF